MTNITRGLSAKRQGLAVASMLKHTAWFYIYAKITVAIKRSVMALNNKKYSDELHTLPIQGFG